MPESDRKTFVFDDASFKINSQTLCLLSLTNWPVEKINKNSLLDIKQKSLIYIFVILFYFFICVLVCSNELIQVSNIRNKYTLFYVINVVFLIIKIKVSLVQHVEFWFTQKNPSYQSNIPVLRWRLAIKAVTINNTAGKLGCMSIDWRDF